MSRGSGLPRLALLHRKCVPPGSDLYEQVLDDLRQDTLQSSSSSSTSPSSLSSSSTLSPPSSERYHVTAQAELRGYGGPLGHDIDSWEGQGHGRGQSRSQGRGCNGDVLRTCPACSKSCGGRGSDLNGGQSYAECKDGVRGEWVTGAAEHVCSPSGVRICEFISDLGEEDAQNSNDMGHSSSLLHHRHHKHDYLFPGDVHKHHLPQQQQHNSHSRPHSSPKRRHGSPSPQSPRKDKGKPAAATGGSHTPELKHSPAGKSIAAPQGSPGHVVSWSVSSGCQGQSMFFTNSDDPDDTGSSSGRPHPPLSRLFPRGSNTQRHSSPSPSRAGLHASSGDRGRSEAGYASPRGSHKAGRTSDDDSGIGRENWQLEMAPSASRSDSLPDVHQPRNRSPGGLRFRSSSSSPMPQRRSSGGGGDEKASRGRMDTLRVPSPSPLHLRPGSPEFQRGGPHHHSSQRHHVRLCTYGIDNGAGVAESSDADNEFPVQTDYFRFRSVSDVSIHAQRRRQLPNLPMRQGSAHDDVDHAHVHWADEERGSPLATSVLLSSIRPRALSHGSVDMPRKPILKKPNGF